jgi:hypothetical protein
MTEQNAQLEGDDIDERPVQITLFGKMFATVDEAMGLSATGPGCIRAVAERLLQAGYGPDRRLELWRGNERVGSTTIAAASQRE